MTASFAPAPAKPRQPGPLAVIVLGVVGVFAFLGLVLAGLVFLALAIAFPIAVPLAISYGLPVSAHDAALAGQMAGFTWLFAALSIAGFAASLFVLVLTIRTISPTEED